MRWNYVGWSTFVEIFDSVLAFNNLRIFWIYSMRRIYLRILNFRWGILKSIILNDSKFERKKGIENNSVVNVIIDYLDHYKKQKYKDLEIMCMS